MRIETTCALALASLALACSASPGETTAELAAALSCHDFDVDFADCSEFAGIGVVPYANAAPLVPPDYELAGDAENAVIVVRAAECAAISVDGKQARPGSLSQIGISLVGPDETAQINNYTIAYVTNNAQLQAKLSAAGLDAVREQGLSFALVPAGNGTGTLSIVSTPPRGRAPAYSATGAVTLPASGATTFVATWWGDGPRGRVSARTELPDIEFGESVTLLTTPPGSALADLIGGTELQFPFLDSYNVFPSAHMEVRRQ